MKKNEEKLNKIFIDLYGLKDQITPDVDEREITVKKADEKKGIKAFIAYGVGCIFGRYSLDQEGIVFAGGKFDDSVYKSFHPIKDNVLPIEGAASVTLKFVEFLKITLGEDTLSENLDFITGALGRRRESSITYMKRYFQNEFYKDHVKMYQRRPIYFLFTSGKHKVFQGLLYIHRFNQDSISNIRKNYIRKLLEKYMKNRSLLKKLLDEEGKNRNLRRNLIRVEKELEELINYDKALMEIENNGLKMNLDDGVKMNYQKLKEVLSKI